MKVGTDAYLCVVMLFRGVFGREECFGEIHLHMVQSGVQMNLERFLDVDVFIVEFMDVFWVLFAYVFQLQQPECFQPNCTFYFRKPLHVFVTSLMFLEVGEEMQVHCQWFVNS